MARDAMGLFAELRRRNVFRVAVAYAVVAWLLAQVSDLVLGVFATPAWVSKTVLFLLLLGFPIALVFAWAYELTPEGIKREKDVDRSQSITHQTGRRLNAAIVVLLTVAVGVLLVDRWVLTGRATKAGSSLYEGIDRSIAVLPFANRSNREEDRFFTDGIHDDLLATLAKIGSIRVISRTSVMDYRDTKKKMPDIAQELDVATVLLGGVQRSGDRIRINVQLIDARRDKHLWAEIYDRNLTAENLFSIQSEVSNAVATALNATMRPVEQRRVDALPTGNLRAYEAYLRGRDLWRQRTAPSVNESVVQFRIAIDLDPGFALAWVGLADAYRFQYHYSGMSAGDVLPKAERAVGTALDLNEKLAEAYASLGGIRKDQGDPEAAGKAFRRALGLNANYAPAYHWFGVTHVGTGRLEEGLRMLEAGLRLDPRDLMIRRALAQAAGSLGRYDREHDECARIVEIDSDSWIGYECMAAYESYVRGRFDESVPLWLKASALSSQQSLPTFLLIFDYLSLGDLQSAEAVLDELERESPEAPLVVVVAFFVELARGRPDAVRRLAEQALQSGDHEKFQDVAADMLLQWSHRKDNAEQALQIAAAMCPEVLGSDPPAVDPSNAYKASAVAFLLAESGRHDTAQPIFSEVIRTIERKPILGMGGSWTGKAREYAATGRKEEALAELRRAVAAGWRILWWYYFDHDPMLASLRDEPEFKALRAEVATDMQAQLARLRDTEMAYESKSSQ